MHADGRSFLLLQGPCTTFFRRLAQHLVCQGHRVRVLNFNGGDYAFRLGLPCDTFRGKLSDLPAFLADIWQRYAITDQVMFGDRRPVHRPAIEHAASHGVRTHVFEEGYLRPHWITLEREGVNGHSLLPRNPDWFTAAAERLGPTPAIRFRSSFKVRALNDVAYHLAGLVNPLVCPHYRNHAPVTAPMEYAGYLKRFTMLRLRYRKQAAQRINQLVNSKTPYFVLPLQLNGDAQIRDHSRFKDMRDVISDVMTSFAAHAKPQAQLVIKNHPLDMGLLDYAGYIQRKAMALGLEQRVVYLESGDLNQLLPNASGMVTVNSTAGLVALEHRCPTLTLSDPIYAIHGLTSSATLNAFWEENERPDATLLQSFLTTLRYCTQVNGGFYCNTGMDLAIRNSATLLEADRSPLEEMLACLPNTA
ncbi:capsule biosynthesis protein [Halomonas halocynthiae]|uniref:capsule biosynthesis protein n=1 Tax=Halomonas halocynthiae TaxID=176290 RepID=UPI000424933B|nr:capsular biosynthesis protein [Halomonas halocynthiae]